MSSGRKFVTRSTLALLALVLFAVALAGCGKKGAEEAKPTPAESPAQASTPAETAQAMTGEVHGKGTCDMCHDAPTLEKMRSGDHKLAFERDAGLHKNLCRKCHEVSSFCGSCHPVPEVVKG